MQQQQQYSSTPSSSHASSETYWSFQQHYPTDYFSLSPTTHDDINNNCLRQQQQQEEDNYYYDNIDLFQYNSSFAFPTPEEEEGEDQLILPFGWTLTGRKRSIFELETNIRTLGELYNTLIDLRSQLPPVLKEEEETIMLQSPFLSTRRSSSFATSDIYATLSRSGSSNFSISSSSPNEDGEDAYCNLISKYPDFIFESLLQLYTSNCCGCCFLRHKKDLVESYHLDKLNKTHATATFAYSALHALLCHSEEYSIYSFLNDLACDAYYTAHELVEFDSVSTVTIETLVIMYQYLYLMGKEGEARNLFCLAWRQMQLLLEDKNTLSTSSLHRLVLWMTDLDWTYSVSKYCAPMIQYHQAKKSMSQLKSASLEDTALKFKIKGLYIILNSSVGQLNGWRSKYLQIFLYKRDPSTSYNTEDKLALSLHALYFSGMLYMHQQQMMTVFETSSFSWSEQQQWTDYFSTSTAKAKTHVEKSLYSSMNAAYGFIQVTKLYLDENDSCQLPHMIDILSAAYTVLYFGNKVTVPNKSPEEALFYIVQAFVESSLTQCPRVDRFLQTWSPLVNL